MRIPFFPSNKRFCPYLLNSLIESVKVLVGLYLDNFSTTSVPLVFHIQNYLTFEKKFTPYIIFSITEDSKTGGLLHPKSLFTVHYVSKTGGRYFIQI